MDQTSFFTKEEQSGSGQLNMLSLIDQNQARVKELRRTSHTYHTDPGHGWLEVRHSDLIILDIIGSISGFSYRNGEKVYLEEDCDAMAYVKALWGELYNGYEYKQWNNTHQEKHQENTFVRNLPNFK